MNKTKITIIIMGLLLLTLSSYVIADKTMEYHNDKMVEAYYSGVRQGNLNFYNSVIQSLSVDGSVTIPVTNQNNQTINVKLVINNTEVIQ